MKNIFTIIILLLITVSCKAQSQLDTLNYIKQFEINKTQYINKPFSYLLSKITQIEPKTVWDIAIPENKNVVKESAFNFCEKEYSFKDVVTLRITWQEDIPFSEVEYYQTKNNFYFTSEEKAFYGNKIVKDIMVYK